MSAREIVNALGGHNGMARCPAHADRIPSLSVRDSSSDRPLVHCHAGCSQEAVISALRGLGLWPEREGIHSVPRRQGRQAPKPEPSRHETVLMKVEYMKDGPEGEETSSRLNVVEVGEDEDGDNITCCVVIPAEPASKAAKKVTGAAKIVLDALNNALCDQGEIPTPNRYVPRTKTCVRKAVWRRYCEAIRITEADTPDAKRKAFTRAVKKLQDLGAIGVWNDWVWRADAPDIPGQG